MKKILGGSLEQKYLVVMVPMVAEITALFADKFIMHGAVCHVIAAMVRAQRLFLLGVRAGLIGLRLVEDLLRLENGLFLSVGVGVALKM